MVRLFGAVVLIGLCGPALAESNATLLLGLGYDNNPSMIEDGATGSAAWKVQPTLFGSDFIGDDYYWDMGLGYSAYRTVRSSETMLPPDPSLTPIEIPTQDTDSFWLSGSLRTIASPRYSLVLAGGINSYEDNNFADSSYRMADLRPQFHYQYTKSNRFTLEASGLWLDFQQRPLYYGSSETRRDHEAGVGVGWWHRWSGRFATQLNIDGKQRHSNSLADESDSRIVELSGWYAWSKAVRFNGRINSSREIFEGTLPFLSTKREDKRYGVMGSLSYPVMTLRQSLDLAYDKLDTNLYGYSYERTVIFINTYIDIF